jgi:hypothetical protein
MSTFKPEYPVMELAVWLTSNATQNGIGHLIEGDIVTVREPHHAISDIEANIALWLRVDGWEREMIGHLTDPLYNLSQADPLAAIDLETPPVVIEKRRYCIPLQNLVQHTDFDLDRALDRWDAYQPFIRNMRVMPDMRVYSVIDAPLDLDGLVWDKLTQRYFYA